jgi:membrane protein required for colicin V production
MNYLDIGLITLFVISGLIGLWRGIIKNIFFILGILGGFIIAFLLSGEIASMISKKMNFPEAPLKVVTFLIIFVTSLVACGILARLCKFSVKLLWLDWLDHLLGLIFGILIGLILCSIVNFFALTLSPHLPKEWQQHLQNSYLSQYLNFLWGKALLYLPEKLPNL